jgi:hypothetical protein
MTVQQLCRSPPGGPASNLHKSSLAGGPGNASSCIPARRAIPAHDEGTIMSTVNPQSQQQRYTTAIQAQPPATPAPAAPGRAFTPPQVEGQWYVVYAEFDGKKVDNTSGNTVTIRNNVLTCLKDGKQQTCRLEFGPHGRLWATEMAGASGAQTGQSGRDRSGQQAQESREGQQRPTVRPVGIRPAASDGTPAVTKACT